MEAEEVLQLEAVEKINTEVDHLQLCLKFCHGVGPSRTSSSESDLRQLRSDRGEEIGGVLEHSFFQEFPDELVVSGVFVSLYSF